MKYSAPKGTKDILDKEIKFHQFLYDKAKVIFPRYGFKEIKTPIFEHTELFLRGIGESSDIVNKEMYTFLDKGNRSITLRPEGTAGVVRAYIENNYPYSSPHQRFFYFGPMFRYEKPQKGRMRQFFQLGFEIFGMKNPYFDAELLKMIKDYLNEIEISDYVIYINNIGCFECRPKFNKKLVNFLKNSQDELCDDCKKRITTNPLRVFDCKNEKCKAILKNAPKITENTCDNCKRHYEEFKYFLDKFHLPYEEDNYLVRGFDYYTQIAFEARSKKLGAQDAFLGGGRYNNLVKEFGGPNIPATGGSFGIERLMLLLEYSNKKFQTKKLYYFIVFDKKNLEENLPYIEHLRNCNLNLIVGDYNLSLKKQFRDADRLNADFAIIRGEDEIKANSIILKDLKNFSQIKISIADFNKKIRDVEKY